MSEPVTLSQALDLAQNMRNHYQAFALLTEVLETMRSGLGPIKTVEAKLEELKRENEALVAQQAQIKRATEGLQGIYAEKLGELEAKHHAQEKDLAQAHGDRVAQLDKAFQLEQQRRQTVLEELDRQRAHAEEAARRNLEALQLAHGQRVEQLDAEFTRERRQREEALAALARERDVLEATVSRLKEEYAALQRSTEQARAFLSRLQAAVAPS